MQSRHRGTGSRAVLQTESDRGALVIYRGHTGKKSRLKADVRGKHWREGVVLIVRGDRCMFVSGKSMAVPAVVRLNLERCVLQAPVSGNEGVDEVEGGFIPFLAKDANGRGNTSGKAQLGPRATVPADLLEVGGELWCLCVA